jgi:hypothetical protein
VMSNSRPFLAQFCCVRRAMLGCMNEGAHFAPDIMSIVKSSSSLRNSLGDT